MREDQPKIESKQDNLPGWVWMLVIGLLFGMFYRLGFLELNGEEPRRAVVAWEMWKSSNFVVPQAYGLEYYNKPPFYHWILSIFMWLFGTSEFVVRLPGVMSFLGIGWFMFRWISAHQGKIAGFLSAGIFLTSGDLILYATVYPAEIDLTFSFILFVQALALFRIGTNPEKSGGYILAYGMLAIAVLTKGWVALHFHALALIAWSLYYGSFRKLFNRDHILSILSFIILLSIYFVLFSRQGNLTLLVLNYFIESGSKVGQFSIMSIINQVTECPMAILKITLPWSLLLFYYFKREMRQSLAQRPIFIFSLIYILSNIWIYWFFVDVRDRYLYPFIPFVAILVAAIIINKSWWLNKQKVILGLMAVMISLRILYGIIVLPKMLDGQLSNDNIYRELVDTLLDITNQQPIDLLVPLAPHDLPFTYENISQIDRQPVIPYQIPYYMIKKISQAPTHTSTPIPGRYYLVLPTQTNYLKESDVLYKFTEQWYKKEVLLIEYK